MFPDDANEMITLLLYMDYYLKVGFKILLVPGLHDPNMPAGSLHL